MDDYFNKMIELERILSDCRINVSMAKSQNGFALSSVGFIDKRDIEPTAFVNINKDTGLFELFHSEIIEESKEEEAKTYIRKRGGKKANAEKEMKIRIKQKKSSKKRHVKPHFRPFGLLESRSAKQARAKADEAIQRCCELSTIQSKIFLLEESITRLNAEVLESLGDVKISDASKPSDCVKKLLKEVQWL
uniref:Vacuolar ATPase assembly protein VMA22 n=1 Tax=Panagrolaimus davidi TaxID=227884 RepID=A0A914PDY0_9BILA